MSEGCHRGLKDAGRMARGKRADGKDRRRNGELIGMRSEVRTAETVGREMEMRNERG